MTGEKKCGCLEAFLCCCQPSGGVCKRKFYLRAQIFVLEGSGPHLTPFLQENSSWIAGLTQISHPKAPRATPRPSHHGRSVLSFPNVCCQVIPRYSLLIPVLPWILLPQQSTAACLLLPPRIPGKFLPSCSFKTPAQPPSLLLGVAPHGRAAIKPQLNASLQRGAPWVGASPSVTPGCLFHQGMPAPI